MTTRAWLNLCAILIFFLIVATYSGTRSAIMKNRTIKAMEARVAFYQQEADRCRDEKDLWYRLASNEAARIMQELYPDMGRPPYIGDPDYYKDYDHGKPEQKN